MERFADSVRRHWSIENPLHWQLDVTFGEDDARMRKDNSPLNWNVMRKTALPFLPSADIGRKTSLKRNMFIAALDISVLRLSSSLKVSAFAVLIDGFPLTFAGKVGIIPLN